MTQQIQDHSTVARFDGSSPAEFTVAGSSPAKIAAIAHEFGYTLTKYELAFRGPSVLAFERDDRTEARHRAA
ncbi:hypothetical protein [Streptomyces litchfieldiae]|uniref:Uncharacterized protein n=1 Tax=Streptomyces litchfieldiae TaxID=3075543 RepID=A0ABU2MRJ0_9ACTN|nr:hypothetical protein [Streptomyces sp. DSM 44938]MDT0343224.1 hypothetical protein [Streptomyces sp. DSM 44938]